jgi:HK97 family phage major capsid protein
MEKLYRRRLEILNELGEIDRRETAASRNYLECDEYRAKNAELEQLNNQITVAQALDEDRERRANMQKAGRAAGEGLADPEQRIDKTGEFKGFGSLAEQLQAVVRAQTPGGQVDPRLAELRAVTGMSEGIGADGGFLVQHDLATKVWSKMFETGQILSRVNRIQISSGANGIVHPYIKEDSRVAGSRNGGVRSYWSDEADTVTAASPKFGKFKLELSKLTSLVYLTEELMEDAAQIEGYVNRLVSQELNFVLEEALFGGNGVGKPLGILTAGSTVSVSKEAAQSPATLMPANIRKMRARQFGPSRGNSVWHINQDVEPQLHGMVQTDSGGTVYGFPVYLPANGLSASPFDTLYGRPIIPIEHCPTIGTVGDIALCDWSQYALIEKGGINMASSIHVRFIYGENVLRFSMRVNGAPGYAWSDSALTPNKGTNTQSPFVVLATRA